MRVGIVGNGLDKFEPDQRDEVKAKIRQILQESRADTVVSGHSPVGGVDIWAEEIGRELGLALEIKTPVQHSWYGSYGYRARNTDIARFSDEVHVIVAKEYPGDYNGKRFAGCYHCGPRNGQHVKSGACWTAWLAATMGKPAYWHIIP